MIFASSGDSQTAAAGSSLPNGLVVQVEDEYGNAVPGAPAVWTTTGGTLVTTAQSTTDPNGLITALLQLPPTAGAVVVTATVAGTSIAVTFTESGD